MALLLGLPSCFFDTSGTVVMTASGGGSFSLLMVTSAGGIGISESDMYTDTNWILAKAILKASSPPVASSDFDVRLDRSSSSGSV